MDRNTSLEPTGGRRSATSHQQEVLPHANDDDDRRDARELARREAHIACNFLFPVAIICVVSVVLSIYVDGSQTLDQSMILPTLLVNGSGSTMMSTTYWRWMSQFQQKLAFRSIHNIQTSYLSVGSGIGRTDFFSGYSLFGATDSDVSAAQMSYFLPDNTTTVSTLNLTQYTNPKAPQHLGSMLLPSIGGALTIIYNIPTPNSNLSLSASVLGAIFCGNITMWNDVAIQQLNPNVTLPQMAITVAGRSDSSGSTSVFTGYLSQYSSVFKQLIGVSSNPKWPANFIKRASALDLYYVVETLDGSISYVPLEAVIQGASGSSPVQVARVINSKGVAVAPKPETVRLSMASTASSFSRHNFISITDAPDPDAYPLSLLSFILLRENYDYFNSTSATFCDRIKEMVKFWYDAFTDDKFAATAISNGWVPISGNLLSNNLQALNLITCASTNIMGLIQFEQDEFDYYTFNQIDQGWEQGLSFWRTVNSSFHHAPISAITYILFYISLGVVTVVPLAFNVKSYLVQSSTKLERRKTIGKGDSAAKSDKGPDNKALNQPRTSMQNLLALFTLYNVFFQVLYLSLSRSNMISEQSTLLKAVSYLGLIIDSQIYYLILGGLLVLWLGCLQYTLLVYPYLKEHKPLVIMHYDKLHEFLAFFLPNFVTILLNPVIELNAKVFDCRLNWDQTFINAYDPENLKCWIGIHWGMATFSLVCMSLFMYQIVRFSKTIKHLRKDFDFKDKEWLVHIDSVIKIFLIILYFNLSNAAYLMVAAVVLSIYGGIIALKRPNKYAWFDSVRNMFNGCNVLLAIILFALEVTISPTNFNMRAKVATSISIAILIIIVVVCFAATTVIAFKMKRELGAADIEKKKKEMEDFFAAFNNAASQNSLPSATNGADAEKAGEHPLQNQGSNMGSTMTGFSAVTYDSFKWEEFNKLLAVSHKIGALSADEYSALTKAVQQQDPILWAVYQRSRGNFKMFHELLKLKVWQVMATLPSGNHQKGSKMSLQGQHGHLHETRHMRRESDIHEPAIGEEEEEEGEEEEEEYD